jgi:hypothetical protein
MIFRCAMRVRAADLPAAKSFSAGGWAFPKIGFGTSKNWKSSCAAVCLE